MTQLNSDHGGKLKCKCKYLSGLLIDYYNIESCKFKMFYNELTKHVSRYILHVNNISFTPTIYLCFSLMHTYLQQSSLKIFLVAIYGFQLLWKNLFYTFQRQGLHFIFSLQIDKRQQSMGFVKLYKHRKIQFMKT